MSLEQLDATDPVVSMGDDNGTKENQAGDDDLQPAGSNEGGANIGQNSSANTGYGTATGVSSGGGHGGFAIDGGRDGRVAARKSRMEASRTARQKPTDKVDDGMARRTKKLEPETKEIGKAKAQMSASYKRIEATKATGHEVVSNIRVGLGARESIRRYDESKKMDNWKKKRQDEQNDSGDIEEQIQKQWENVNSISSPYALQELLDAQKQACTSLIALKAKLMSEYAAELKSKDDEYVKELKRQADDIDKLLERMNVQFKEHQKTLVEELEHIEKAFVEERTELIETNKRELESLFEGRRGNEVRYMNERADRVDDHIKQLESLRVHDAEEYNLVKIKLETDVQVLEQQLQQMRATYQLNTEKLEYNFQVLKKREEENGTILGAQKRKINRLTDHLNMLKSKAAKQEKACQQENLSLTDDYKHLTEQYKELQKKFRHFQLADSKKYKEVWKMNEEEARELMRKVLQADRIIHEQQLGEKWEPPSEDLFRNVDPAFFNDLADDDTRGIEDAQVAFEENLDEKLADTQGDTEKKESLAAKFQDQNKDSKLVKKMLELLCNEAGFLVEDKLQKLLSPLHRDEQSLMRLDSIFKALGVDTVEDIEKLTSYFLTEISHHHALTGDEHDHLIHPNDAIKAIRKFTETHLGKRRSNEAEMDQQLDHVVAHGHKQGEETHLTVQSTPEQKQIQSRGQLTLTTGSKALEMQKQYWERMSRVIDDDTNRTWTTVYNAMEKYNTVLSQRWRLSQEISSYQEQNRELKALLRQYMAARVNDELQVPPTQIILAQAGMLHHHHQ